MSRNQREGGYVGRVSTYETGKAKPQHMRSRMIPNEFGGVIVTLKFRQKESHEQR